ncbi:Uncharacterised protein [Bordetella pertussis]|nr:Uncharacterised protein [Bordetella pertussis]CFL77525.1 Uncharacterised protein [Bordetella pertussis]CFL86241.1 Uncharacterised protein [Bordetella pertussis]CFM20657.1 Uncharacterised protein [Bordetella pertussis]CFM32063.1 Uncharacterised protein [Bordetella pertussis]
MPAATSRGNSARTCSARVGDTWPNVLADGAATPPCPLGLPAAKARSSACATGCEGQRMPMLSWPPLTAAPMWGARLRMSVSGPGQNAWINWRAAAGTSLAQ